MARTILITGGAGFIGSNLARHFALTGDRVVVCDWLELGDKWRNLIDVPIQDFLHPTHLMAWLETNAQTLDAVIHMGAISATTERDGDKLVRDNIRLSLDLWEFCTISQKPFIYASSAATYGDGQMGFDDDWSPAALAMLRPLNAYGWSKHVVDQRVSRDALEGRPTPPVWAGCKFFNVFGPREFHKGPMRSVVVQVWETIRRGDQVTLFRSHNPQYPDGGQMRDFVSVGDCVAVIDWMLQQTQLAGIYNIGTGKARTFLDLANAVFAARAEPPRIGFVDTPEAIRDRYQYFTEARMDRLVAAGCGHRFANLETGIADYVAWLEAEATR